MASAGISCAIGRGINSGSTSGGFATGRRCGGPAEPSDLEPAAPGQHPAAGAAAVRPGWPQPEPWAQLLRPLTHDDHRHQLGLRGPGLRPVELWRQGPARVVSSRERLHRDLRAVREGRARRQRRRSHRRHVVCVAILAAAFRVRVPLRAGRVGALEGAPIGPLHRSRRSGERLPRLAAAGLLHTIGTPARPLATRHAVA